MDEYPIPTKKPQLYDKSLIVEKSNENNFNGQNLCELAKQNKLDHIFSARYVIIKKHLDYMDEYGLCALHYACKHLNFNLAEYLLGKGCDPNIRTKSSESPLDLLQSRNSRFEKKLRKTTHLHQLSEQLETIVKDGSGDTSDWRLSDNLQIVQLTQVLTALNNLQIQGETSKIPEEIFDELREMMNQQNSRQLSLMGEISLQVLSQIEQKVAKQLSELRNQDKVQRKISHRIQGLLSSKGGVQLNP